MGAFVAKSEITMSPQLVVSVKDLVFGLTDGAGCFTMMGVWPFEVAVLHPGTVKGRSAACTGVIVNASVVLSATAHTVRFEIFSFITFLFPFNRSRWFAGDI